METTNYLNSNKQNFLNELFELLRIPSVSADSKYKDDILRAAEYIKDKIVRNKSNQKNFLCKIFTNLMNGSNVMQNNHIEIKVYSYEIQPSN